MKLILGKAKPYPEGVVRSHAGKKYKKVDGGWLPVKDGMTGKEAAQAAEEAKKNKTKNKLEIQRMEGTREIYNALHTIAGSKEPIYLDDMKGKTKSIYNSLTKNSLITWTHVAHDEYKAELTEAGKKAHDAGHAYFHKVKREQLTSKDSKADSQVKLEEIKGFEDLIAAVETLKKEDK